MKSTIISMIIVLAVMVVVPMVFLGDGNLADKFGFGFGSGGAKQDLTAKLPKNVQTVVTDKKVEVYKWVDEHGVMQFSNTPPPEGGASDKVVLSPDTNVIQAYEAPQQEATTGSGPRVYNLGSPYSPEGMKNLVQDSLNVQQKMNERQAENDKMMEDIFKKK